MRLTTADVCVIYNPTAGRGRARLRIDRLRRDLGGRAEFRPTGGPGDAEALAMQAAVEGFPIVAAAGGDGTVHEVANGLLRSGMSQVIFAPIPAGSANDYVHSLGLADDWQRRPDPAVGPGWVDVGLVRSGGRSRYFVNGFGAGFNGLVTRESRRIRRLRGLALYGLAVLRVILFHYATPTTTVRLDDGEPRTTPTLGLSLALGRREGNFVVAPQALAGRRPLRLCSRRRPDRAGICSFLWRKWQRNGCEPTIRSSAWAAAAGRRSTPRRR